MASPSAHGHMAFTPDLVRSKTLSHAEHAAAAASLDDGDSSFGSVRRMDRSELYDELWNEPPSPQVHRARTEGRAAQGKGAGLGGGIGEGRDGDGGGGQQQHQQLQQQTQQQGGGIARTFSKQLFLSRIGTNKVARNSGKKETQHRRRPSADSAGLEMRDKDTPDFSVSGGRGSGSASSNSGGSMAPSPPTKEKDGRKGSPSKGLGSRRRLTSRSIGNINFSVPSWAKVPAVGSAPKSPTSECIVRQLPHSNSTGDSGGKSPKRLSLSIPAAQDVGGSSFSSRNISSFSCDPAAVAVALEEFQAGSSGSFRARVSPLRTKSPVNQRMATVEAIPRAELAEDFSFQSHSMPRAVEPQLSPLQQQQQEQQLSPQPQQQTSPHQQQQQQQQQQQHPPPKHRRRASMELPPLRDVRSAGGSPATIARQQQKSPVRSASAVRYMSSFEEHRRRVAEAEKQERSELVVDDDTADPSYAAAAAAAASELAGAGGGGGIGGEGSRAQGRGSSAASRSRLHRRISSYTSGSAASAAVAAVGEDGADNGASGRSGHRSHRRSGSFGSGDGPGRLQPQQRPLPPQYQPPRLSAFPPMDAGDVTPDGAAAGPEWPCAGLPSSRSSGSADGDVCGVVSKMGSSSGAGGGSGSGSGAGRIPDRPSTRRGQERHHQGSCGELDLDLVI